MLIKWLVSTLQSSCSINSGTEWLNAIVLQFCNNLKYVGVLKQISNEQPQQQQQQQLQQQQQQPAVQAQQQLQPAQQITHTPREQDVLSGFSVSSMNF